MSGTFQLPKSYLPPTDSIILLYMHTHKHSLTRPLSVSHLPLIPSNSNMGSSDTTTTFPTSSSSSSSPLSSPASSLQSIPSTPPPPVILSPCAACKVLRRRCVDKCILAPYFPPSEPLKFTTAHRVFGASNIIKLLQELPEDRRADAVSSMAYEANARVRDPVYGCAGVICQLQKEVDDLQLQLARAKADALAMRAQQANLIAMICMEMAHSQQLLPGATAAAVDGEFATGPGIYDIDNDRFFLDENSHGPIWESLWT